jgi:antitoxin ParD1/3/4
MQTAEKLSITLSPELAQMIRDKVTSGAYASNSEVIREALRLLQARDQLEAQKLTALRKKVERSLEQEEPSLKADEVFAHLEQHHQQRIADQ